MFHAGTKFYENKFTAVGGRVLNIVALSDDFKKCKNQALDIIKKIDWSKGFFRKDIGFKVIK